MWDRARRERHEQVEEQMTKAYDAKMNMKRKRVVQMGGEMVGEGEVKEVGRGVVERRNEGMKDRGEGERSTFSERR